MLNYKILKIGDVVCKGDFLRNKVGSKWVPCRSIIGTILTERSIKYWVYGRPIKLTPKGNKIL
jgi:hypothetical protein